MSEPKKSPIRLNSHAKSLFLRHSSQCLNFGEFCNEDTSDIFKLLNISRGFLNASRQYKVYFLEYHGKRYHKHKICLRTVNTKSGGSLWAIYVSLNELVRLRQLLNILCVEFKFDAEMGQKTIDEYKELFEKHLPQVKLDITFDYRTYHGLYAHDNPSFLQFISTFSKRILNIKCEIKLLQICAPLKLDCCVVEEMKNFDKLKEILKKHTVKSLKLDCTIYETQIPDNYFEDFPICLQINAFDIKFYSWDQENPSNFQILKKLLEFLPNLQNLCVRIHGYMDDSAKPILFANAVLDTIKKVDKFRNDLNPSIKLNADLYLKTCADYRVNYSSTTELNEHINSRRPLVEKAIELLKKHPYFKDAEIDSSYRSDDCIYDYVASKWKKPNFTISSYIEFQVSAYQFPRYDSD